MANTVQPNWEPFFKSCLAWMTAELVEEYKPDQGRRTKLQVLVRAAIYSTKHPSSVLRTQNGVVLLNWSNKAFHAAVHETCFLWGLSCFQTIIWNSWSRVEGIHYTSNRIARVVNYTRSAPIKSLVNEDNLSSNHAYTPRPHAAKATENIVSIDQVMPPMFSLSKSLHRWPFLHTYRLSAMSSSWTI